MGVTIYQTKSLRDILARNIPGKLGEERISMTRAEWQYGW